MGPVHLCPPLCASRLVRVEYLFCRRTEAKCAPPRSGSDVSVRTLLPSEKSEYSLSQLVSDILVADFLGSSLRGGGGPAAAAVVGPPREVGKPVRW
jgi:hypothetical protein